jgi:hypothetical protein
MPASLCDLAFRFPSSEGASSCDAPDNHHSSRRGPWQGDGEAVASIHERAATLASGGPLRDRSNSGFRRPDDFDLAH